MKQIKQSDIRILYIQTNEISLLDIPRVLDEMGYDVYQADFGIKAQEYDVTACKKIVAAIGEFHIRCAISYDFVMTISQACMETGIPYIAWVYDAPQSELYTHYAMYPCNYIFAFDKMQVRRLKAIGIKHVVHMPLAVHRNKIDMVTNTIEKKIEGGYQREIAFIGQLYKREEETLLQQMNEKLRRQMYQNIEKCFLKWDKNTRIHGLMSEECVAFYGELEGHRVKICYPYMSEQFYYEAAILSRMIANRERVHILNSLADKYDVTFYTNDKDTKQLSEKVKVKPGLSYDVLSHIYYRSKINLNITLHCIETGVPQRVLDVMAAGGFMLSNYQEELEEMFVPGEEIVLYHNEQELLEKIAYYLAHDEEREQIAHKGQEKVLREYNYQVEITKAFQYVHKTEKNRRESYIALQRAELRKQADLFLSQKTEESYLQLYELLTDKKYDTTIRKTIDLAVLQEMLKCWRQEREFGESCIFDDVDSLQQAEQKYMELKHGLWRIEQNLSYEKCMETVKRIRQQSISMFFISWVIYAELQDQENTIIKLSKLMAESDRAEAVRLLSYGLLILEGKQKLLMQQANYLLDMQLWEQALRTLQKIESPTEELKESIEKLSNALHKVNE